MDELFLIIYTHISNMCLIYVYANKFAVNVLSIKYLFTVKFFWYFEPSYVHVKLHNVIIFLLRFFFLHILISHRVAKYLKYNF